MQNSESYPSSQTETNWLTYKSLVGLAAKIRLQLQPQRYQAQLRRAQLRHVQAKDGLEGV